MKCPDLANLTLIRPGYFSVWLRFPDGCVTECYSMFGNPLEQFLAPIDIMLTLGYGGSKPLSGNSGSTSGQNSATSFYESAKDSQRPPEVSLNEVPEGSEEDAAYAALDLVLDDAPGQMAMMQIFVNGEDAMRLLPKYRGQVVLPLEVDLSQKSYRVQWPVPVYSADGKPWNRLNMLQKAFEKRFQEMLEEFRKQKKAANLPQSAGGRSL